MYIIKTESFIVAFEVLIAQYHAENPGITGLKVDATVGGIQAALVIKPAGRPRIKKAKSR